MSRPPRPQFAGAICHVTSRGNRRAHIYLDDRDYLIWMDTFGRAAEQFGFVSHGFCQMPNHFHLLLETPHGNLSEGMHFLNGVYAKHFNERHGLSGHVMQGRFHAVLLQEESHFMELTRYITLNPVRAKLASSAADWRWSNYRYTAGLAHAPQWLETAATLGRFSGATDVERIRNYCRFVEAGIGGKDPLAKNKLPAIGIGADRRAAIENALRSGHFTQREIAEHFGVSLSTVRRIAK